MATTRAIRLRIRSVNSTQHITKAMNLVSASKLQRARNRLDSYRPFFIETRRVTSSIVSFGGNPDNPYFRSKPVKNAVLIVITADRGLCGGYNSNVSKLAFAEMKATNAPYKVISVGNKGRDYFKRRGAEVIKTFNGISETPFFDDAQHVCELAKGMYDRGEADAVYLAYTEFKSIVSHNPVFLRLFPIDTGMLEDHHDSMMTYEPEADEVLNYIIPRYADGVIYGALAESAACQHGARMFSMDSATNNAVKMIASLTLKYNRARQGAITQEITEIVSGANALE